MNWYKLAQDFGSAMQNISNAVDSFSTPYNQQQGNPDNSLDTDQMRQQLDIDSALDPEIRALEEKLIKAEDEDKDGKNDLEQLSEKLSEAAKGYRMLRYSSKTVYAESLWLNPQIWQRMGVDAENGYKSNLNSFNANMKTYTDLKNELEIKKNLYDNKQITDKGVLSTVVDNIVEQIGLTKPYGIKALKMREALTKVKETLDFFSRATSENVDQNSTILQQHYNTVSDLVYSTVE